MLGVVRNLTIVNFAIIIGIVAYAHAIGMGTARVIPLVLTALLSAVPVALPATFTLAATLGAKTLALKGVLLTRLSALHEAAMIDVLCADKTGTLTANELGIEVIRPVKDSYREEDVLSVAALASSPDGQDPVDIAIRAMAQPIAGRRHGFLDIVHFTPFDPVEKMAKALVRDQTGRELRIVKGAPTAMGSAFARSWSPAMPRQPRPLSRAVGRDGPICPPGTIPTRSVQRTLRIRERIPRR